MSWAFSVRLCLVTHSYRKVGNGYDSVWGFIFPIGNLLNCKLPPDCHAADARNCYCRSFADPRRSNDTKEYVVGEQHQDRTFHNLTFDTKLLQQNVERCSSLRKCVTTGERESIGEKMQFYAAQIRGLRTVASDARQERTDSKSSCARVRPAAVCLNSDQYKIVQSWRTAREKDEVNERLSYKPKHRVGPEWKVVGFPWMRGPSK